MRLHETHPQREWLGRILFQVPYGVVRDVGAQHLRFDSGIRQLLRIEPDARRILKRFPGRFRAHLGRYGPRLHVLHPCGADLAFGHHHVEAEEPGRRGAIQVHFPEDGGAVAGRLELFRQRRLVQRERRGEARHTRHVRQLSGEETLPRRSADRRIAVVARKARPLRCQPVQVRRGRQPVAVAAHHVCGVVVGQQEEEIRLARGGASTRRRRRRHATQKRAPAEFRSVPQLYFTSPPVTGQSTSTACGSGKCPLRCRER